MDKHKTKIIAISGTSGGGKTTTVTELQKRTPNSITLSIEDGDYEKNSGIADLAQWEEDGWDESRILYLFRFTLIRRWM